MGKLDVTPDATVVVADVTDAVGRAVMNGPKDSLDCDEQRRVQRLRQRIFTATADADSPTGAA